MNSISRFLMVCCAAIALTGHADAQQIGVVSSLQPAIEGTPPGANTRPLAIGVNIVSNERVVSSSAGRGQLLFQDQTTLTIAPNSEIILDRFVYDPNRSTGEIAISLTKGALRFIGGQITKQSEGTVRTPTATIGIRGGLVLIQHLDGATRAILLAGDVLCLDAGTGRHCASRPGAILTADGYQGVAGEELLTNLLRLLDGEPEIETTEGFFNRRPTGGNDVGSFERSELSTRGEERDLVVFEDAIRDDILDGRAIGGTTPVTGHIAQPYVPPVQGDPMSPEVLLDMPRIPITGDQEG